MTDFRSALQDALGDAFLLERELSGGMSRVFVARDTALGRRVVVKVLPSDLAASLSSERFRREIQIAASLQHSHIVPLLTAGVAGGFLYYTMPFVEGESLRERLAREGELPVPSALRILEQVARALSYAHRHGVVHRDIKPANILLSEDEALIADFGIAKAIRSASEELGPATSAGIALGTPAYMAPEQAAADLNCDHRADLYSLGVVAYEMLAGQPPFQRPTPAQLFAAHLSENPLPLRAHRPAVPPPLEALVVRLLEKHPADRYQSADEVLRALEELSHSHSESSPTIGQRPYVATAGKNQTAQRWIIGGGAAALAVALVIAAVRGRERPVDVDPAVVAVAPFRVTGADSSLGYLREGMVDLLAAKLSGTTGLRAVDPRGLLAIWRKSAGSAGDLPGREAIRVAGRLGAGRLIHGDVVGTPQQITINAAILEAPGGRISAAANVEGPSDSLPRLVDQLAAKLLALQAGEGEQRLSSLTSTSLPALRAYLDGQALMRRGEFIKAAASFKRALQYDSTFALAGLGVTRAGVWFGQASNDEGVDLAWRYREKLSETDRVLLMHYAGDRYRGPRPWRGGISAAERLVQLAPDNAEAWFELADDLYHWGPVVGTPDALRRSAEAFDRSLALDSSFVPALEHGPVLALGLRDTVRAQKALSLILRRDSMSPWATSHRWVVAHVLGDSAGRRAALRTDSVMGPLIIGDGLSLGFPLQDADAVLRSNRARAVTAADQARLQYFSHMNAIITGWPSRAPPLPTAMPEQERFALLFLEARFAEGDSAAGAAAGAALEKLIGSPIPLQAPAAYVRFAAGQRAFDTRRLKLAERAALDLRSLRVPPDSTGLSEAVTGYALLLEAQLAARLHSAQLPVLLKRLDSALAEPRYIAFIVSGNLIASRLFEEQGNLPRALAAIRRRPWDLARSAIYVTYHREEGRLAALTGDREGAIQAYRRYLALRSGAEPRLQPLVAQVRSELAALEQEAANR